LEYVHQLAAVDTTNTVPFTHAAELTDVDRPDDVGPSLLRDAALGNAPNRDDECFLVPAVL
jgi:aspartyl-tRNA(Asn)/glutamyl-tRNA(Gln) amidotransferase subunit C